MRVRRSAQPPSLAHHDRSRAPEPGETRRPSELPPSEKATLYCAKGESPRELPLLLSCLPSARARDETIRRFTETTPNRGGLASRKKILGTRVGRVGRVLVSASCSSGVRHMLEFASYVRAAPERARTRRGCTTRGRGVLGHRPRVGRHAGRSGSATWLGTGGTTRRRNLSVPKGIYLDRSDDRARPGVPAS